MPKEVATPKCGHTDCFSCPYPDCSPRYWRKRSSVTTDAAERMAKSDKQHLRVANYERMMELYKTGLPDSQIAKELGLVDQGLVCKWRARYNLPANGNKRPQPKFDYKKARELYDQGQNDRVIAEAMDVDRSQVYQWRKREQLEPNACRKDKQKMKLLDMIPTPEELEAQDEKKHQDTECPAAAAPVVDDIEADQDEAPVVIADFSGQQRTGTDKQKQTDLPIILEPDLDELIAEIEQLRSTQTDLLIKNSELAGFIDGVKFAVNIFRAATT